MERKRRLSVRVVTLAAAVVLAGCSGEVAITAVTVSPQGAAITFSVEGDVPVPIGSVLLVSIDEPFDSYAWALDGETLADQTSSAVSLDSTALSIGVHHLAALVERGSHLYSNTLRFSVQN